MEELEENEDDGDDAADDLNDGLTTSTQYSGGVKSK